MNWIKNLMNLSAMSLLLLAGCTDEAGQGAGSFQRPPTPVEATLVAVAPVTDSFSTVGSIEAGEAIMVTSEIDGMVTAIPFREGGPVNKGDLIAQLDDAQLKAEVQRARALFSQTKATWDRVKSIVDQGAGSPQDLDDALAALKVAEANLALAETRLQKTRITAPFSGLTGKRIISHGSFLRAGSPITSLAQIEKLRVTFAIPERILASLKVGAQVQVTTTAFADQPLTGIIDVIEPQLDPLTRNVAVVALVDNAEGRLRPGMSATIDVVLNRRAEALTVPSEAVFVEGGQAFVYVIKADSTVTRSPLTLGTRLKAVVEVVGGLSDGQQVVKAGHQKLYEGAKVAPTAAGNEEGGVHAMKLSEVAIKRPVFATVMSLAILLLGYISFTRLPVREFPETDPPIVSVTTLYRGASPNVVETEITDVLEEQFTTIESVKTITSSSREQGSVITIEFELSRDVDEAANDVRDRVSRVGGRLPREAEDPIVAKVDVNAQPIIWLAISSDKHSTLELSDYSDRILKERLQRLPGVGNVFIGGERRYAMRVWLDPLRMAAYDLTVQDVERAIRAENAEIPGGRVEGTEREFAVRTRGELNTPEGFGAIIVAHRGNQIVRLNHIAEVEVGPEDERTRTRFNDSPSVGLGIVKQKQASTLEVAEAVRGNIPELESLLPAGMSIDMAYDSSEFIEASVSEVQKTILVALCLVVLVVFVFLKSLRATVIPILAIPVSVIGAFAVAFALGFTINILTLLALVLAIGLVVDDAIVVLENIVRHVEMGKSRRQAAFDGSKEIGFAVVATTVALVAVFIPVAFLTGAVGRLFREFGITLAVAVMLSSFVALTLTPVLCSRLLKKVDANKSRSRAERSFDAFFDWLGRTYTSTLRFCLRFRPLLIFCGLALVAFGAWIFGELPEELVPTEDRGTAFGIVLAPEGATLDYTDRYMRQIEAQLLPLPERNGLFTATGLGFGGPGRVTNGFVFLNLKNQSERERSQQEVVAQMFPRLLGIPGVLAFLVNPPSLGGNFSSSDVEYVLQADSYEELGQAVGIMMAKAGELGYLINLDSDLRLNKPELEIQIDRERASGLGVSVTDIGTTLETYLGGRVVGNFKRGAKQYDVIAQMRAGGRSTPDIIEQIYLRGAGGLVQLANVVTVTETVAPKELNHFNRVRSASITANLAPGVGIGQALDDLDNIWRNDLPKTVKRDLGGQSREYRDSKGSLYFMFVLALVFIFLVLSAQFESFIDPMTILLSVPLAVFGALLSLWIFDQTLNIFSRIGLIMLIGLVTKNAILIVEFANQLRARGMEIADAVIEAAGIRLRPILMTSFSTVFGILPIAIGFGAGAESRRPLGIVVVGGVMFSTFLTLLLVPVVYSLLAKFTKAKRAGEE